jgi:hypothetical protein
MRSRRGRKPLLIADLHRHGVLVRFKPADYAALKRYARGRAPAVLLRELTLASINDTAPEPRISGAGSSQHSAPGGTDVAPQ